MLAGGPERRHPRGVPWPLTAALSLAVPARLTAARSCTALAPLGRQRGAAPAVALGFRRGTAPRQSTPANPFRRLDVPAF